MRKRNPPGVTNVRPSRNGRRGLRPNMRLRRHRKSGMSSGLSFDVIRATLTNGATLPCSFSQS